MAYIHDLEVDSFLKSCVTIDRQDFDQEFTRLPADLAYWNEKYAQSLHHYLNSKIDADRVYASLIIEHRERMRGIDPDARKGPTVDAVKAAVEDDVRWEKAQEILVASEVRKVRVRGIVEAVMAKKDMLQSLGAKLRAEMQDPIVRAEVSARRIAEQE